MNYKIENGIAGQIIIFNDGLKQETYFDIPTNILNIIKELQQDNQLLEIKLQQKQDIINKAKEEIKYLESNCDMSNIHYQKLNQILDNKWSDSDD